MPSDETYMTIEERIRRITNNIRIKDEIIASQQRLIDELEDYIEELQDQANNLPFYNEDYPGP